MRKTLVLLFCVLVVASLLFFWMSDDVDIHQVNLGQPSQITNPQSLEGAQTQDEQIIEAVSANDEAVNSEETKEKPPSNICKEQLAEQYPELDKQFNHALQDVYLSGEQMAGEGVYQNMSFENLKPLADANNPDAMMVYGSEMIWYSATGIRVNRADSQYRTQEQTKNIIKTHKVNLNGVIQGQEYLYKAAVFGKEGAIFESAVLLDLVARNLNKEDTDEKLIMELLSKSLSYKKLIIDIHQHDPSFRGIFGQSMDPFNNIQRLYADREDYAEIRKQIESDAENMYQELKERWEHDREYYGFEIYPDYLKGELEEYGNAYLDCHMQ